MAKHKKRKLNSLEHHSRNIVQPSKKAKVERKSKPTIPFDSEDRILLVGEGDFSFAKSIVIHHGCWNVTATCLDSKEELYEKFKPQAEHHTQFLVDEGQTVIYNVNATTLGSVKGLKNGAPYDRIVFNFPHVGGKTKDVNRQVRFNQELLVKFFTSAIPLVATQGTIVITLFEGEPYTLWNIRDLARHSGLEVKVSFKFEPDVYPGYSHARTLGNLDSGKGWKGEDRDARSYVFQRKEGSQGSLSTGLHKRKKKSGDSSSDEGE